MKIRPLKLTVTLDGKVVELTRQNRHVLIDVEGEPVVRRVSIDSPEEDTWVEDVMMHLTQVLLDEVEDDTWDGDLERLLAEFVGEE